jgi:hypothetical protein
MNVMYRDKDELPVFDFNGETIIISGRAIPEHAGMAWVSFLEDLKVYVLQHKKLTIEFKLDYFNSASSRYITDMFNILEESAKTTKSTVNWYYFQADETTFENGEIYQERARKVKINLIERHE